MDKRGIVRYEVWQLDGCKDDEDWGVGQHRFYLGELNVPMADDGRPSEASILKALKKTEVCSPFGERYHALTTRNRKVIYIDTCADNSAYAHIAWANDFEFVVGVKGREPAYGLERIT